MRANIYGIQFQNSVAHEKMDIFRDRVQYNQKINGDLPESQRLTAVNNITATIKPENEVAGALIDVMLFYRDVENYQLMIDFIEAMPHHVQQTVMVQEQYGFALNRMKSSGKAQRFLIVDRFIALIAFKKTVASTSGIHFGY